MADAANLKSGGGFTIDVRCDEGGTAWVKCQGRLVWGQTAVLQERVRDLLPKSLVIDLSGVDFMDSAGLGAIVRLYVSAKTSGGKLQLVNLAPRVRELFGLARLLSLFEPCGQYNIRVP